MGSSNQLFSGILLDLNEIEKQEKEVNTKLSETKKELDYIDSLIHKYEEIRISLLTKMTSLQNQKDTCASKRRKVVQKMNAKLNESTTTTSSSNNGVEYSKFDCLKITESSSQNLEKHEEYDDESKALDHLVAEILKTLNDGGNSHELQSETSIPSIKDELKYSNGGTVHVNPLQSLKSLRIEDNFFEKVMPDNEATFAEKVSCNSAASLDEVVDIDNGHSNNENNFADDEWMPSMSPSNSSQAPRFYAKVPTMPHHKTQYNSVLSLESSVTGYIYKSLNDGTVMRYRFANVNDNRYYRGHTDKVKVLYLDSKLQQLYTGCDDGKVRSFNTNTGSLLSEFCCDGNIIAIEKFFDGTFIFGTNKGWIYLVNCQFELQTSHRTFNWIFAVKGIVNTEKDLHKKLIVVPMKHKPSVIDAISGKILQEIHSDIIESRPCIQLNGNICILATVVDKAEPGKSMISIFDANNSWKCSQTIAKDGVVSSLCTKGPDLYVGLKYPTYGHIQCFKWANKMFTLKWVACVAYVHTLAVMPSDIVLNGGPDGNVYNTTPNLKGPFLCSHKKCTCKLPFARRKDLEFHYSKLPQV